MPDAVKCVSRHVEDLADGRVIAPGETVFDVDANEGHNKSLVERGAIIVLDKKQAKANQGANTEPKGDENNEEGSN